MGIPSATARESLPPAAQCPGAQQHRGDRDPEDKRGRPWPCWGAKWDFLTTPPGRDGSVDRHRRLWQQPEPRAKTRGPLAPKGSPASVAGRHTWKAPLRKRYQGQVQHSPCFLMQMRTSPEQVVRQPRREWVPVKTRCSPSRMQKTGGSEGGGGQVEKGLEGGSKDINIKDTNNLAGN